MHPHPKLSKPCTSIKDPKDYLSLLEMVPRGLLENGCLGVGLAGNQIGKNERICIVRFNGYNLNLVNLEVVTHFEKNN